MGMTSHGRRISFHYCAAIVQLSGTLSANIAGSFRALWNETFLQLSVYVHALYPSWGYVVFILLVVLKFLEPNGRFVLKINFDIRDSMSLAVLSVAVNHGHVDCSVSTCDCKNILLGKRKALRTSLFRDMAVRQWVSVSDISKERVAFVFEGSDILEDSEVLEVLDIRTSGAVEVGDSFETSGHLFRSDPRSTKSSTTWLWKCWNTQDDVYVHSGGRGGGGVEVWWCARRKRVRPAVLAVCVAYCLPQI
jgi:hypothetical protein